MIRPARWGAIRLAVGCALVVSAAAAGCGASGVETVPVQGVLTFPADKKPQTATVYFSPLEPAAGLPRRPGSGKLQPDGSFTVASFRPGDGLVPGTYRVKVECYQAAKGGGWNMGAFELDDVRIEAGQSGPVRLELAAPPFKYGRKVSM
jgi:hypothetical protein